MSRYGVRYSKRHVEYQQHFRAWVEDIKHETEWPQIGRDLCGVELEFISTKARTSRILVPRYDLDNASKLILDCWTDTKLLWHDDNEIVHLASTKRFAEPDEASGTWFSVWLEDDYVPKD